MASVVGVRHRLAAAANDDAFAWSAGARALWVAVADGVGSVPGSGAAALLAVDAAVSAGSAAGVANAADPVVDAVSGANRAVADGAGATTLVVGVVAPDGSFSIARVGDSSAFVLASGTWRELFSEPEDDEGSLSTATAALPAGDPPVEVVSGRVSPGGALVLVTDGVANPLRDGPGTVAPALAEGLVGPPSALQLAGLVDFSRQGCHDDRTVLAVWPLVGDG